MNPCWKLVARVAKPRFLQCMQCGREHPYTPFNQAVCEDCGGEWLEAHYDYDAFKRQVLLGLPGRPLNLWRYQDILPIENPNFLELYPAGGTPLWQSKHYAPALGHQNVYIKDERYGPTSSFKDRQAAVAVAAIP